MAPEIGKIYIKNTPYKSEQVVVLIGLTGMITGSVVVTFTREIACKIAPAMMMGMPVMELNEISKSAISELCNMIMGNTATNFSNRGIDIGITPPIILTGDNMELTVHKSVVLCIPLLFQSGTKIELDISYMDKVPK